MVARIVVFVVLTAFFLVLLGGSSQAMGLAPELGVAQLAPGIAGLLMLLIFRKDALRISVVDAGIPAQRYLLAFAIPAVAGLLMLAASLVLFDSFTLASVGSGGTVLGLAWMPFGVLGEEVGWRGYLAKRLSRGVPGLAAAGLTGALWTLIHVHFFGNGLAFMLAAVVMFVAMSVVVQAVVAEHDFNVVLAFLFHLGINLSLSLSLVLLNELTFMAVYALLWVAAAGIAVAWRRDVFLRPAG